MSTRNILFSLSSLAGIALVAVSLRAEPVDSATVALRPLHAQPSAVQASPESVVLYKDSRCRKDIGVLELGAYDSNTYHKLPKGAGDEISSLRWNLPAGVVVVFYENGANSSKKGIQYAVFGNGEDGSLDDNELNDELSSWAWYRIE